MLECMASGVYRRLAVFDLDHTLLDDHAEISDDVAERLKAARSPDLACTIASGRDMQRIVPFLNRLEWLSVPVIAEQGAVVADPADGRLLLERMVSREIVLGSLDVVRSCDLPVRLILYGRGEPQEFHRPGAPGRGDRMRVFTDEHDVDTSDVRKITLICAPEDAWNLQQALNRTLGSAATVVRADVNFLNVMNAGVSKGTALAWLISYLGIARGNVMAV
ncbi:MAG TPA: HAD hydrolase family protein, partial [Candidatus Cryosericum sp.]|nr:HAD hydrolase family protein [Candidatus Cryosericum sp.]